VQRGPNDQHCAAHRLVVQIHSHGSWNGAIQAGSWSRHSVKSIMWPLSERKRRASTTEGCNFLVVLGCKTGRQVTAKIALLGCVSMKCQFIVILIRPRVWIFYKRRYCYYMHVYNWGTDLKVYTRCTPSSLAYTYTCKHIHTQVW